MYSPELVAVSFEGIPNVTPPTPVEVIPPQPPALQPPPKVIVKEPEAPATMPDPTPQTTTDRGTGEQTTTTGGGTGEQTIPTGEGQAEDTRGQTGQFNYGISPTPRPRGAIK